MPKQIAYFSSINMKLLLIFDRVTIVTVMQWKVYIVYERNIIRNLDEEHENDENIAIKITNSEIHIVIIFIKLIMCDFDNNNNNSHDFYIVFTLH